MGEIKIEYKYYIARMEQGKNYWMRVSSGHRNLDAVRVGFQATIEDAKAVSSKDVLGILRQRYAGGIATGDPSVVDAWRYAPETPPPFTGDRGSDPANEHYGQTQQDIEDEAKYAAWWEASRREAFGEAFDPCTKTVEATLRSLLSKYDVRLWAVREKGELLYFVDISSYPDGEPLTIQRSKDLHKALEKAYRYLEEVRSREEG